MAHEKTYRIFISAGESSGDQQAAEVVQALVRLGEASHPPIRFEFFGVGGKRLKEQGVEIILDARELNVMGFSEIVLRLPRIFSLIRDLEKSIRLRKPDLILVTDFPDFHFKLVKQLNIGKASRERLIPKIYFIPPKIWAWRKGRIKFLQENFDRVLSVLPFEVPFYESQNVKVDYVGNPHCETLPWKQNRDWARARWGLTDPFQKVVVMMPGSRRAELKRHLKPMLQAVIAVQKKLDVPLTVLIPLSQNSKIDRFRKKLDGILVEWGIQDHQDLKFLIREGFSAEALLAADAGLIKSGTSTLEAAVLGCPHVVVFLASPLSTWIYHHLIRYEGPVALSNLVSKSDREGLDFPERVGRAFNSKALENELIDLLNRGPLWDVQRDAMKRVRERILDLNFQGGPLNSAAQRAASIILESLQFNNKFNAKGSPLASDANPVHSTRSVRTFSWLRWGVSWIWSSVNRLARWRIEIGSRLGFIKKVELEPTALVISVGNIQAGGTGKTPVVATLANRAIQGGKSVCILTRGYGGNWENEGGWIAPEGTSFGVESEIKAADAGDEALLLHQICPKAWIGIGKDRKRQYEEVKRRFGRPFDWIILDDGFQQWKIERDFDFVLVSETQLGRSWFRDFPSELRRADAVLLTKGFRKSDFQKRVRIRGQVSEVAFGPENFSPESAAAPAGAHAYLLVTAIGDPDSLEFQLKKEGWNLARRRFFPDHAFFDRRTIDALMSEADAERLTILMTGKDWVKWREITGDDVKAKGNVVVLEPHVKWELDEAFWRRIGE